MYTSSPSKFTPNASHRLQFSHTRSNSTIISNATFTLTPEIITIILTNFIDNSKILRYKTFRTTSLISKIWTLPSQKCLNSKVELEDEYSSLSWKYWQKRNLYKSEELFIDGRFDRIQASTAEQCVSVAKGLVLLRVDFVRGLSSRIFTQSSNLLNLKHLILHTSIYCDSTPIEIKFKLKTLTLGGDYFPLAFLYHLFNSSVLTLEELVLNQQSNHSIEVRTLLDSSIKNCQNLQSLTDLGRKGINTLHLIESFLPPNLKIFTTSFQQINMLNSFLNFFSNSSLYSKELKVIRFTHLDKRDFNNQDSVLSLKEKEIKFKFGMGEDYRLSEELMILNNKGLIPYT